MRTASIAIRAILFSDMNVLVLNAGSSSLKFQVVATDLDRIRQSTDAYTETKTIYYATT